MRSASLIAIAATPLIARLVPTSLPIAEVPAVDLRLLGLAAMVTFTTGIAFGVLPAVRVARSTRLDALRETTPVGPGRATERLRSGLVVAEIAASVVLLVAAGLLMRALWNVQQVDPGFRTEGVLTMRTALPWPAYRSTARREQFYDRVLTDVRALPGVKSCRLHQLPADGDARRRSGRSRPKDKPTTPPSRAASASDW